MGEGKGARGWGRGGIRVMIRVRMGGDKIFFFWVNWVIVSGFLGNLKFSEGQ